MGTLRIRYDGDQHCTARREPQGNSVAMDCPYTGKGEEFSPGNLVGAALAGCMFLSMGTVAQRSGLDLTGAVADVELTNVEKPVHRIGSVDLAFTMPARLAANDRTRLERAAGFCPLKASFHPDVRITVSFDYQG